MIKAYPVPVPISGTAPASNQNAIVWLQNGNGCCGMWELVLNAYNANFKYDKAYLTKFKTDLVKMAKTAAVTTMTPSQYSGVRGAGVVMVNLVVEAPQAEEEEDAEDFPEDDVDGGLQTKFIPLLLELGFRRVKTYYNPRSENTLRMYYITGADLYAALVK